VFRDRTLDLRSANRAYLGGITVKAIDAGSTRIGFIGLGLMGLPMARNLLTAGFDLLVHTRTAAKARPLLEAGASEAGSSAELAAESDVVITMLPDSPDVAAVMRGESGVLAGARPGTTWIDMSTISPNVTRELAREASEREVASLDAPVSGGPPGAAAGTLSIMVGGADEDFDRCLPLLRCLGQNIVHMGGRGAGQVTKACNQIVVAGTLTAVAEALVFGRKAGVDPAAIRGALLGGYAGSRLLEVYGQRMIERDFEPGFFVRLLRKDVHLALEMAREMAASTPVAALVAQLLNGLVADGDGELDASAVVKLYERLANQVL
jgi:2-hydroxy-3-oxopropionate reductase